MYYINSDENSVRITHDKQEWLFPKGTLLVHANAGDKQSVNIKLKGSRKLIMSFNYKLCNITGSDAEHVASEIAKII